MVIAGRVIQGIGAAAIVPSSLGLLLDATPPHRRATATAFYSALSSLGGALGPTVGASVVKFASWRWSFLLSPVIAGVSYGFGRTSLPHIAADRKAKLPDVPGALIIVVMLMSLSLAIVQGRSWGWSSVRVEIAFAVAVLMVPVFILRSRHHPSPVLPLRLFSLRSFACANVAAFTFGVSTGAVLFSNVQFLNVVWQRSVFQSGLGLLPLALTAAIVAPFAGRLGARFGERAVAVPGALVIAAGIASYRLLATAEHDYFSRWLPGSLMFGAGLALTYPMIAAISVRGVVSSELSVAQRVESHGVADRQRGRASPWSSPCSATHGARKRSSLSAGVGGDGRRRSGHRGGDRQCRNLPAVAERRSRRDPAESIVRID